MEEQSKPEVRIEEWKRLLGGTLQGKVYGHPDYQNGELTRTSSVIYVLDKPIEGDRVETSDVIYILGKPDGEYGYMKGRFDDGEEYRYYGRFDGKTAEEVQKEIKEQWDKCPKHEFEDTGFVIDTLPPQYVYKCERCGAVTHDPATGEYCFIKHYV